MNRRAGMMDQGHSVASFSEQIAALPKTHGEKLDLAKEIDEASDVVSAPFESRFKPSEMRQLALVAHNHMKPAMKEFIMTYSEALKKFRITGTQTTMRMCKQLWGEDDPDIVYGLTCASGPLGGDAQLAALMCIEDLGALIFFVDPLSAHPHQADIDSLIRLSNCGNVILCPNPTSAMALIYTIRTALIMGNRGMIPSFFHTLESPAVEEYKLQQELALARVISGGTTSQMPTLGLDTSTSGLSYQPSSHIKSVDENEDDDDPDASYEANDVFGTLAHVRDSCISGISDGERSRPAYLTGMKLAPEKKSRFNIGLARNIMASTKFLRSLSSGKGSL